MKWAFGGVLAADIIFSAPASSNTVLRIDTANNPIKVSTFGHIEGKELNKFRAAVMASGFIFFVPAEANKVVLYLLLLYKKYIFLNEFVHG